MLMTSPDSRNALRTKGSNRACLRVNEHQGISFNNIQHITYTIQHATYNIQHATYNIASVVAVHCSVVRMLNAGSKSWKSFSDQSSRFVPPVSSSRARACKYLSAPFRTRQLQVRVVVYGISQGCSTPLASEIDQSHCRSICFFL